MRTAWVIFAACAIAAASDRGLPVRSNVTDYSAHAEDKGITVAAALIDAEQVRGSFSTDLKDYVVIEVAVYPKKDAAPLDLDTMDFALHIDGRMVRPTAPRSIARINQNKGKGDGRDVTLWPSVGVHTGSWGTGTNVGVGVGVGGRQPRGPASTDRDREVMEQELDDKAFPDALISKPTAGYLYFPAGSARGKKIGKYMLEFDGGGAAVKLTLPVK